MFDANEHIDQPLLNDDQPSWVTMENTDEAGESELPWDRHNSSSSIRGRSKPGGGSVNEDIPKIVLFMRLGNLCAAALLIFGSIGNLTNVLALSKMVLAGYGVCFGGLICCLEVNLSFLRQPIADNFGFLYNPMLRLMFYFLMGMVAWSFGTLLGVISSIALAVLSLFNTFVICRYPGYRAALKEIADMEEERLKKEMNKQIVSRTWRHAVAPSWMSNGE
eukprot:CCRYP_017505-RA/>CCRYP_017505-RA protein AED:0.21 eAED:0.21 QI:0/0/0/1/1/1/2/0/219